MRTHSFLLAALATGAALLGATEAVAIQVEGSGAADGTFAGQSLQIALSERPSEYEIKRREAMRKADNAAKARWAEEQAKAPPPAAALVVECRYLHMLGDQTSTETTHWSLSPNHFHEWDKYSRTWGPNQCVTPSAGTTRKVTCAMTEAEVQFAGTLVDDTGYARDLKWTLDRTTGEFRSIDIAWLKKAGEDKANLYANKNGICRTAPMPQ